LQKNGLWYQVDVAGETNGKGWVFARYLERIPPKALTTEPPARSVRGETAAREQKKDIYPIDPPPKSGADVEATRLSGTTLADRPPATAVKGQSSARNELRETKNESNALPQLKPLINVEPVHLLPVPLPYASLKQRVPEISAKDSSERSEKKAPTVNPKSIPGEKKKLAGAAQADEPTVNEQPMSDPPVMASSAVNPSGSQEKKDTTFKRRSKGPVEIALKLVSIVLYSLVVLLLYKKN
jgi:hypothetical protein